MKTVLENGVTVIASRRPSTRAVSVGIWVRGGSAADPTELSGIAHFCEHMAFKATIKRSAAALSEAFDAMGGCVNAYTAKLHTCYYCKTLEKHLAQALSLLAEMLLEPAYEEKEVETERKVILEEIAMVEDSPDDLVNARLCEGVWRGSVLGREILGTAESVSRIGSKELRASAERMVVGTNLVVVAAGCLDEAAFSEDCRRLFGKIRAGERAADLENGSSERVALYQKKEIEQLHLCLGFPSYPMFDERRYALSVLSLLTGGTMSSRLFRAVREEAGLAYQVQSYLSPYLHTGLFCVYAALSPDRLCECLSLLKGELEKIRESGFSEEEIRRAKDQLISATILDGEGPEAAMKLLAKNALYEKGERELDAVLERIEAVRGEEVFALSRELFDPARLSISLVGPFDGDVLRLREEIFGA